MKNKKDLQAFMREKLAKTKISSEATSSIQPIAQGQKNFNGPAKPTKTVEEVRASANGPLYVVGPGQNPKPKQPNIYKPTLKPKESSNYVSGPSKPPPSVLRKQPIPSETKRSSSKREAKREESKKTNDKQVKAPSKVPG